MDLKAASYRKCRRSISNTERMIRKMPIEKYQQILKDFQLVLLAEM